MNTKFRLNIGCHRHTFTSRDSEVREFDTEAEAIQSYRDSKTSWATIGYVVWFAEIIAPDGTKRMIEQNPCY